jgi:hypothetical protein
MKRLNRRTLLRGAGAAMALPLFEAMLPRSVFAQGASLAGPVNRMAFIYIPNGAIMPDWNPTGTGRDYQLSKTLAPLAAHQQKLMVLSGLAHDKARANGDGPGDHARDSATYLTGAQARKTDGADIHLGKSVDQFAADAIGELTRLPSLELGTEAGRQAGRCDSGYSCAYQSNISWRSATTPTSKEINPKAVFERLFGNDFEDLRARQERDFYRQSILDFVADDASRLRAQLGTSDREKLDEYFTSVREIEQRIARAADDTVNQVPDGVEVPDGIPSDFAEHVRLMYDLMALAFQTDSTRISTFMLANSGSNRSYPEIEVSGAHHEMSHHRGEEDKMADLQKIDLYMVEQFAYFLDRLDDITEGEGTLLDHSMIVYGGALSDANAHDHHDLPVVLAGGGCGQLDTGRHVEYDGEIPMANLFLSLLDRMGVDEERIGDSTGRLDQLS